MPRIEEVTVLLPGVLRPYCGGADELSLAAPNVRVLLERIEQRFPSLHRHLCDETGTVRRHLNIFVNTDNTRDLQGAETPLAPGDVVTVLPAVSGG